MSLQPGWLSDPADARRRTKAAAIARLAAGLRAAGATDAQIDAATRDLRALLTAITSEEYPTPWEWIDAVDEAVAHIASGSRPVADDAAAEHPLNPPTMASEPPLRNDQTSKCCRLAGGGGAGSERMRQRAAGQASQTR
jgi:hypothetical protein